MRCIDERTLGGLHEKVGTAVFLEMLDLYLSDASMRVETIRERYRVGDWAELVRATHALKGSSVTMGALPLAELCADLQHSADHRVAALLVDAIAREYERVRSVVVARRQEFELASTPEPVANSR